MPQPELPPELIHRILDNLANERNKKALCAVSLACHNLHNIATPLIYSDAAFLNPLSVDNNFFNFVETMLNNPHLASLLKSYAGDLYPKSSSLRFEPLKGWLQNIVNVKSMCLFVTHNLVKNPFPKCPFRLEFLRVAVFEGNELDIEPFLEDQPDLTSLTFNYFPTAVMRPLSPLACPNLKVLAGNSFAAKSILPGRKIVRFEWEYDWYWGTGPIHLPANSFSEISEELNYIRSLSYKVEVKLFPESVFTVINPAAAYLRSLRFLEIEAILPEDWAIIPTLPNLRVVFVLEAPHVALRNASLIQHQTRIPELFSESPTLQRIDLHNPIYMAENQTCYRWLRGVQIHFTIPLEVAEKGRTEFLDDNLEDI
ncbi:hypothetical protein GALMADRAFT_140982 [Galerina marginata CBS 339.88]|uniref:F-box domain-containing protein n=1 Tax=Galerina marginata (strain CBS 339.88) TaxID=685588 RepID=A0A067SUP9_GALM3|nr:hypothetical protein GALMADRAFT_140982 [Galerina marginata CBS 339.88]